jgi:diguanylate cyclase (GGDEF)-like protein
MADSTFTLQNRITTLIILSSLFFIAIFTFVQINNQTKSINRYNTYQANLSGAILKNNLELALKQSEETNKVDYLQSAMDELSSSNIIKETILYDQQGKIIASNNKEYIGETTSYKDLKPWEIFATDTPDGKWISAEISKLNNKINIYIAVKSGENSKLEYIAKSSFPFASTNEALAAVYKPVIMSVIIVILVNIIFGYTLSKTVLGPIKLLNKVTKIIAGGDLSVRTNIKTQDELQELGTTFNYMAAELSKMKERAENANPLTKLPGNIVIHEEIEKKIADKTKFMVIYCDLDNFKAFNDKYGIGKGDEAIKITADVFKDAMGRFGNPNDFLGHEGGDDFILLTSPDKAQSITNHIIQEFDKRIRSLYSKEDAAQGYIIAHARDNSIKQFPIMTISLAGVTNETRSILNYGEVTNIAAEVKKKAKAIEGSIFVIDKRQL